MLSFVFDLLLELLFKRPLPALVLMAILMAVAMWLWKP